MIKYDFLLANYYIKNSALEQNLKKYKYMSMLYFPCYWQYLLSIANYLSNSAMVEKNFYLTPNQTLSRVTLVLRLLESDQSGIWSSCSFLSIVNLFTLANGT